MVDYFDVLIKNVLWHKWDVLEKIFFFVLWFCGDRKLRNEFMIKTLVVIGFGKYIYVYIYIYVCLKKTKYFMIVKSHFKLSR